MRDQDTTKIAADMHRLANKIELLSERADTLDADNVDTRTSVTLNTEQEIIQEDLNQLIADLIQMQTESGTIETERGDHRLGRTGNVPIPHDANTDLPPPRVGQPARGEASIPDWAKQGRN